jgi:hypothetical protein
VSTAGVPALRFTGGRPRLGALGPLSGSSAPAPLPASAAFPSPRICPGSRPSSALATNAFVAERVRESPARAAFHRARDGLARLAASECCSYALVKPVIGWAAWRCS